MTKICLITCYSQPDYVRARTLRASLSAIHDVELIVVKNTHTNILRYPETLWRTLVVRATLHPDIYFQTFRAYESFPFFRLITAGKPFIFDEFINPIEHVAYENHIINPNGLVAKIAWFGYKAWLWTVDLITTDTPSHAKYSAQLMKIPLSKYFPLIVSTDEETFAPQIQTKKLPNDTFTVFYYGLFMTPLQGLDTILEAMRLLKGENIKLVLIGGKERTKDIVKTAQDKGANVEYKYRVQYDELASYMADADLCLGGPFGGTLQAQFVIGGKTYQFLNMGRPVVIGRNHESHIWKDKENALIIDQASPRQLADAIEWARKHPSELQHIAKAGKQLYDKELSNTVLTEQLRRLLVDEHVL
jgi:glycosyltransferase involved in cell wall biosynthesis